MVAKLKTAAWSMLAGAYYYSGLPHVRNRGQVAILTYHRVVSDDMVREERIQAGMYVRVQSFESQIDYLRKRFVVLSIAELLELWRTDRFEREKSYCVITFDDGWRDNYLYAFPLLRKRGVSATIFLATDYIGTARWFWPDEIAFLLGQANERKSTAEVGRAVLTLLKEMPAIGERADGKLRAELESGKTIGADDLIEWCKGLQPELIRQFVDGLGRTFQMELPAKRVLLDWDEVRQMADHGVTFGAHSCSHRIMTHLSPAESQTELTDSWQTMLRQGIKPVPVFCYPNGDCDVSLKGLVANSGYLAAVGCEIGLEGARPCDPFALRRISVHEDATSSVPLFALTLSGLR